MVVTALGATPPATEIIATALLGRPTFNYTKKKCGLFGGLLGAKADVRIHTLPRPYKPPPGHYQMTMCEDRLSEEERDDGACRSRSSRDNEEIAHWAQPALAWS